MLELVEADDGWEGHGVALTAKELLSSAVGILLQLVVGSPQLPYLSLRIGLRGGHLIALAPCLLLFFDQCVDPVLVHTETLPQALDLSHQVLYGARWAKLCC